jgi:hypothetical protein
MVLMPIGISHTVDAATADALKMVVQSGAMGCGILETDDCQDTYEQLQKQGAKFRTPPTQRPYGIEASLLDDSGNWFSSGRRCCVPSPGLTGAGFDVGLEAPQEVLPTLSHGRRDNVFPTGMLEHHARLSA